MGLDRTVRFRAGNVPAWATIKEQLARVGEPGTLRMIDSMPAFPDETPEDGWSELRVAAGGAMVTIRRSGDALVCVVWGNADAPLLASWNRFVWACAASGAGAISTDAGEVAADQFAQLSDIRPA